VEEISCSNPCEKYKCTLKFRTNRQRISVGKRKQYLLVVLDKNA